MKKSLLLQLVGFLFPLIITAQSLPVGLPVLEDYERRKQLLDDAAQTESSFTIRPLQLWGMENISPLLGSDSSFTVLKLMPIVRKEQYSLRRPENRNDGAMIPARGYQTMMSGGIYLRHGVFSLQVMPEFVYAENRPYDGLSPELLRSAVRIYDYVKRHIDLPDRFGEDHYRRLFLGQSSLRMSYYGFSLGVSNENLWWGPGIRNSLLMTNSAPGFKHITLNTTRPINTYIGKFEGQIVAGKLQNSGFQWTDSTHMKSLDLQPREYYSDWRYLNAMVVSYQPRWLKGLTLGATRSFTMNNQTIGFDNYRTWFPLLEPIFKSRVGGEKADTIPTNQNASVFARWVMPEAHTEIYFEYGKEDHNFNMEDLLLEPDHYRAYVVGARKLVPLKRFPNSYFDIGVELTQFSKTVNTNYRSFHSQVGWYTTGKGDYTHQGQILGAGIGTSSNMQSLNLGFVQEKNRINLELYRYLHDDDIWAAITMFTPYGNLRTHWVDYGAIMSAGIEFKKFYIDGWAQILNSLNYMYLYQPIPSDPPDPWDKGPKNINANVGLSIAYVF